MNIASPTRFAALAVAGFALSAQAQKPSADLDIPSLSASQAARALCAGRLSSEQLVSAYIAQIGRAHV